MKCNVDGSVRNGNSSALCADVFRDASGMWMFGFVHNLGSSSIVVAELWGILFVQSLGKRDLEAYFGGGFYAYGHLCEG